MSTICEPLCVDTTPQNNFTLYYNILDYFRVIMSNHPGIQRVTQGDLYSIDVDEFPSYPLGNILIVDVVFQDSVTLYNCQLTVADKVKLKTNDSIGRTNYQSIPYYGTDDVVDIHSNTLAILNDLISYTKYKVEAFDIFQDVQCIPFRDNFDNGLAGWSANFVAATHNDRNRCLFDLDGTC
jgi:hypothetical protein